VIGLHRDAQRLLEPLAVVNPYATRLTFADTQTRTRRDHGKFLALIAAVTLLHQHQRPRKTATVSGQPIAYVESTLADIQIATGLAHQVLGRSLDEVAPQTRRLLAAIHTHVTSEAARLDVDAGLVRFTRRQLREQLGFGDTQLKIHLARLLDLELLTVHRAENTATRPTGGAGTGTGGGSGGFVYELLWRGEGQTGQPFLTGLAGLTDLSAAESSPGYDSDRSGQQGVRSGPGRGPVGGWSGSGRAAVSAVAGPDSVAPVAVRPVVGVNGTGPGPDHSSANGRVVAVGGGR
jgi:hypothetical protein